MLCMYNYVDKNYDEIITHTHNTAHVIILSLEIRIIIHYTIALHNIIPIARAECTIMSLALRRSAIMESEASLVVAKILKGTTLSLIRFWRPCLDVQLSQHFQLNYWAWK